MNFDKPPQPPGASRISVKLDQWDELRLDEGAELDTIPMTLGPADHMAPPASSEPWRVQAPGIDPGGMSLVSKLNWRVAPRG